MQIREVRKLSGVSQIQVAQKLGISQGAVAMWETGKRIPKTTDLPKIAEALNVSVETILECFIDKG